MSSVRQAVGKSEDARRYLQGCERVIMLVHACRGLGDLRALGDVLVMVLPAADGTARAVMESMGLGDTSTSYIDWYVIDRDPGAWQVDPTRIPWQLRIFRWQDEHGQTVGRASCFTRGASAGEWDVQPFKPLMMQLEAQFLFICRQPGGL